MLIHSKKARKARDRILDQVVAGEVDGAIETYRDASGADAVQATRTITRLHTVLQTTGEPSTDDQKFLDDFREGLNRGFIDLVDRPHDSWPKHLVALASYVLLALATFNVLGAAILLLAGSVAAFINPWFGFVVGILLAGPMFIVLPGILRGVVVRRSGVGHFVRSPGFGWEIALGFVLLVSGVLGTVLTERVLWAARADVVEIASPDELATVNPGRSDILHIRVSRVPTTPAGFYVETRRDRQGSISRSEYSVRPLIGPQTKVPCWWVGQAGSSFSGFQHPVLELDDESPYFVSSPTHREEYEQAVANALGAPAPDCTRVFERVPHPEIMRAELGHKQRRLVIGTNLAASVLLVLWGLAWVYRRLKGTSETSS